MKIYIVAHKNVDFPQLSDIYQPLQVGASLHDKLLGDWCYDNQGNNISDKNSSYNELTGLYWIWKNSAEDVVGLCHYRRFFVTPIGKMMDVLFGKKMGYISSKYIEKKLVKADMIVHNKTFFSNGNKNQFISTQQYPDDIDKIRETIERICPEYLESLDYVMNGKKSHLLNMMIARKEIVDQYCEWLFNVLFETEKNMREYGEIDFNRRMGMLGERLLDVWIHHNHVKYTECFSINTERRDVAFIVK